MFTARYGLNYCITQIKVRFVFKRLIKISHFFTDVDFGGFSEVRNLL